MMKSHAVRSRFRLSIRSLMWVVALSAIVLLPLAWAVRQRELMVRALRDAERARALGAQARADAMKAMYAGGTQATNGASGAGLWAALRVNHTVLSQAEAKDLDLEFSLVNDGDAVVDPKLGESRILINGKVVEESGLILGSGSRDARSSALGPGDHLRLAFALGDFFKKPGTYRVTWRGTKFQSPDVFFRVLDDEKRPAENARTP